MILPMLSKPSTCILIAFLVICLTGCNEDISLLDDSGNVIGKGTLEITAIFPSPARLLFDGHEYKGLWHVTKIYEEGLAKSRRLISSNAYMAYLIGNDPEKLKHGQASLAADDGSKIECDFYYRSQPRAGSCNIDGKLLKLMVQNG